MAKEENLNKTKHWWEASDGLPYRARYMWDEVKGAIRRVFCRDPNGPLLQTRLRQSETQAFICPLSPGEWGGTAVSPTLKVGEAPRAA